MTPVYGILLLSFMNEAPPCSNLYIIMGEKFEFYCVHVEASKRSRSVFRWVFIIKKNELVVNKKKFCFAFDEAFD